MPGSFEPPLDAYDVEALKPPSPAAIKKREAATRKALQALISLGWQVKPDHLKQKYEITRPQKTGEE